MIDCKTYTIGNNCSFTVSKDYSKFDPPDVVLEINYKNSDTNISLGLTNEIKKGSEEKTKELYFVNTFKAKNFIDIINTTNNKIIIEDPKSFFDYKNGIYDFLKYLPIENFKSFKVDGFDNDFLLFKCPVTGDDIISLSNCERYIEGTDIKLRYSDVNIKLLSLFWMNIYFKDNKVWIPFRCKPVPEFTIEKNFTLEGFPINQLIINGLISSGLLSEDLINENNCKLEFINKIIDKIIVELGDNFHSANSVYNVLAGQYENVDSYHVNSFPFSVNILLNNGRFINLRNDYTNDIVAIEYIDYADKNNNIYNTFYYKNKQSILQIHITAHVTDPFLEMEKEKYIQRSADMGIKEFINKIIIQCNTIKCDPFDISNFKLELTPENSKYKLSYDFNNKTKLFEVDFLNNYFLSNNKYPLALVFFNHSFLKKIASNCLTHHYFNEINQKKTKLKTKYWLLKKLLDADFLNITNQKDDPNKIQKLKDKKIDFFYTLSFCKAHNTSNTIPKVGLTTDNNLVIHCFSRNGIRNIKCSVLDRAFKYKRDVLRTLNQILYENLLTNLDKASVEYIDFVNKLQESDEFTILEMLE